MVSSKSGSMAVTQIYLKRKIYGDTHIINTFPMNFNFSWFLTAFQYLIFNISSVIKRNSHLACSGLPGFDKHRAEGLSSWLHPSRDLLGPFSTLTRHPTKPCLFVFLISQISEIICHQYAPQD